MAKTTDSTQRFQGEAKAPRNACIFTCPEGAVQLAEGENQEGRFAITAYDGGVTKHWYWGNFAIDLKGLTFAAKRLPVLDSHWTDFRLGFTTEQSITDRVTFEGQSLRNARAKELRQDMLDGFPMQASLYTVPHKIEQIAEGTAAEVNGHKLMGPGAIFRQAEIQEVSMCVFGALKNTQSTALADNDSQSIEFELLGDSPMANPDKPALTVETFKADHPEVFKTVFTAGQAAGIESEKSRFAALQKACGADHALAGECFTAGLTVADALGKANEKLTVRLREAESKLAAQPAGGGMKVDAATAEFKAQPAPKTEAEKGAQFDEAKATDEQLKAHFEATPALRDQFSSAKAYVAAVRHPPKE